MAVTDALHGVRVSIMAGDTVLKEYDDRDDEEPDGRTVTRYVEAKSDQEFRIECEVEQGLIKKKRPKRRNTPGNCLGIKIYVDGNRVDQFIVMRNDVADSAYLTESLGLDQPGGLVQKYRFSTLETVDEELETGESAKLQQLGTIRVEVHWKKVGGAIKGSQNSGNPKNIDTVDSISEKALKGQTISHSVSFAAPEQNPGDATRWRSEYVDEERRPAATFVFKYRSLETLESMLILPCATSPGFSVPLVERDPSTLTAAEQIEVIKSLQAERQAQKETARRETIQRTSTQSEVQIKIKREHAGDDDYDDDDAPPSKKIAYTQTAATRMKVEGSSSLHESPGASLARSKPETIVID